MEDFRHPILAGMNKKNAFFFVLHHEWELIKENQISSLGYLGFTHLMFVKYVRYIAYYLMIPEYNEVHCLMGICNLDLLIPKAQHSAFCILNILYTISCDFPY